MLTQKKNITKKNPIEPELLLEQISNSEPPVKKNRFLALLTLKNLSIFLTAAVFVVVSYYILFPSRGYFHSDSADTIMWAGASYESGTIFNPNFCYACLLPFGGHLIMIPLVAIFGVSMTAQVISMFIFFALLVSSLFFMLRQMGWNTQWSCFTVSILTVTLSVSEKLREIFWGHIIYYSLGIFLMFVAMGLLFKAMRAYETHSMKSKAFLLSSALLFIWFILSSTNHIEALTMVVLPVLAGFAGERFFNFKSKMTKRERTGFFGILIIIVIGTALGIGLGALLKNGYWAGYQNGYSMFTYPYEWLNNALKFPADWLTLLGVNVTDSDLLYSANGIANLVMIISAFVLMISPIILTFLYPKLNDRPSKILIIAHWVMTMLIMVGYVFGALSSANWRLSPIVCTSVILTAILCKYIYQNTNKWRLIILLLAPVLLTQTMTVINIAMMKPTYGQDAKIYALVDFLEENDLTYGYSTFWNGNAVTVVSDSRVKSRAINVIGDECVTGSYQVDLTWYDDVPGQKDYFLILEGSEYYRIEKIGELRLSEAVEVLEFEDYHILVFDKNPFTAQASEIDDLPEDEELYYAD